MKNKIIPKVDYIILCDSFAHGQDGKKTIYGIFDIINAKSFPAVQPIFCVVTGLMEGYGEHSFVLQICDPEDKIIFKSPEPCLINLDEEYGKADVFMQFAGVKFETSGVYKINIILNDKIREDGIRKFWVKQI